MVRLSDDASVELLMGMRQKCRGPSEVPDNAGHEGKEWWFGDVVDGSPAVGLVLMNSFCLLDFAAMNLGLCVEQLMNTWKAVKMVLFMLFIPKSNDEFPLGVSAQLCGCACTCLSNGVRKRKWWCYGSFA